MCRPRQREEFSGPLIDALQAAQKIVYNRSLTDVCPVDWRHLLTKPAQAALEEWAKASCNGVRDYTKPLEEGEEAPSFTLRSFTRICQLLPYLMP